MIHKEEDFYGICLMMENCKTLQAYCKDAYKLFKIKILCGKECPIYKTCPWIVLGDTADKNAKKIMREMIRLHEKSIS